MGKIRLVLIGLLMIISLSGIAFYYWYQNDNYVETEDARVDGDIIKVSPQVTGKIVELPVEEGQFLKKDDYIGRQSDLTLAAASNIDLSIIKAPISGTVIKKTAHPGEIGSPGVPLLLMADLKALYITANIEEDKLKKLKPGQKVEFTLDLLPGLKFTGNILNIGNAANSVFSLLPQQNTGNSFVKITQRVPVKISIADYQAQQLLPGMNAVVKIHIK